MKIIIPILFSILFCVSFSAAQAPAADTTDNQFWNETQVIFPLVKKKDAKGKSIDKLSFFLNGNLRIGQDFRHFVDERIGFGFIYKANKYVSLTPSYIYVAQQPTPTRKLYESRLRFAVGLENHWKNFAMDDRNLVEYRLRNSTADSVRYRNKFRFAVPVKKDDKEIFTPYAADEVYYDFHLKAISRNELTLGVTRKLTSNLSADFFYLWQTNKTGSPKNVNVFGINLKIKID